MPAQIKFYGGDHGVYDIDAGGSGIGFFGNGDFGTSIAVGAWNDNTWITDGNGTVQGAKLNNWKWVHANSGDNDGTVVNLSGIPNSKATLNVRFTNDSPVKCQNVKIRIYDRSSIARGASGVTTRIAELVRPNIFYGDSFGSPGPFGSGGAWTNFPAQASATIMTIINQSPGISGAVVKNTAHTGVRHDWYFSITSSPDSVGSKTQYGLFFQLEYL